MAYFPNGTAGELFESRECRNCVHQPTDEQGCAVFDTHMLLNYDQTKNEHLRQALSLLIDDENNVLGSMCQMRIARDPNRCQSTESFID